MRTISNLRGVRQILRIESAHVAIDESRVMEGTFTFDSTMVEGSVFQIGTAVADEINVTVVDPNGELNTYIDETYSVYLAPFNANRSQATWTLIGQYVVAELDTSYSGRAKVKFQDRMVTLDVPVDFQSGTLYANLQNLGVTLSLTQEEVTFLSGLSVLNRQTMTKRDFIRGCALLMWENAYLKPDGKLAFRSITTTAQTFTPSDRFSSELGDEVTIGPVRVIDDSGAVIYTMGSASGQTIEISSTTSPMISLIGSIEGLATYYSTATIPGRGIADFSYTPLTMSLLSTWALEPGDVVSYIDKDNNTYTSVVTSVAHVLNGASACTSAGEAKVRQSQQIPVQTDEARAVIQQLETGIDTAQSTASEAMPKYGSCDTAASTKAKVVTGIVDFSLKTGTRVALLMEYSNTANEPTLNINGTGAKPIVTSDGVKLTTTNNDIKSWLAGSMVTFVYDGTNWRIDDNYALTRINHIWADTLHGTNGDINLKDGTFNYGLGKLVWNGSTLTVNGTVESITGHIGGWTIGSNVLTSSGTFTLDDVSTPYSVFMQAPATAVPGHAAFAVRFGDQEPYDYPFLVQYNGTLTATKANITGTINATGGTISGNMTVSGTLTGGTISGSTITGSVITGGEINITATTSTFEHHITSDTLRGTLNIGGTKTGSSNSASLTIDPVNGSATLYGSNEVKMTIDNGSIQLTRTDGAFIGGALSVSGAITESGSRLNQKVSGMAANGSAKSLTASTWTSFDDTYTLAANHRYLVTYNVEFASNASGYRLTRATIGGSTAGNISTQRLPAISGQSVYVGATFWIQASSSSRTLGFDAYHTASTAINGTLRYQVIDFGV